MVKNETQAAAKSQEYINFETGLKRLLAVPKAELDQREKEWKEASHKRGRPKKAKKAD